MGVVYSKIKTEGHGAVGKNNVVYVTSTPPSSTTTTAQAAATTTTERDYDYDVGIIIAKDHECEWVEATTNVERRTKDGKGQVAYFTEFEYGGKKIACGFMNDMGKEAVMKYVPKFLKATRPRFLTTVGMCGGREVGRVHFVDKAWIDGKIISLVSQDYIPKALDRNLGKVYDNKYWDMNSTVLSIEDRSPTEDVLSLLETYQVNVVDMEIAWIWLGLQEYNRSLNRQNKTNFVCTVKGVSDTGPNEQRDENGKMATERAIKALLAYIWWLRIPEN